MNDVAVAPADVLISCAIKFVSKKVVEALLPLKFATSFVFALPTASVVGAVKLPVCNACPLYTLNPSMYPFQPFVFP